MKIDRDGFKFSGYFLASAFVMFFWSKFLFVLVSILAIWSIYFFRDPDRTPPSDSDVLVSPADGKVIFIGPNAIPGEVTKGPEGDMIKISIFMNIVNVHVNRAVASGIIEQIVYMPGKFFNASFDKASEWNERNSFVLSIPAHKSKVVFTQIAGLIARRIRCDVFEKKNVEIAEKVGIIRFGSRLDVYFPANLYDVSVKIGQQTIAGETIIARLKTKD